MGAHDDGSETLEGTRGQMRRTVDTSVPSDGVADVGGESEGSQAQASTGIKGDGSLEEQGTGTGMGMLVRVFSSS